MIQTEAESERLRAISIDVDAGKILISRLEGSDQESDISEPVNCAGLGCVISVEQLAPGGPPIHCRSDQR